MSIPALAAALVSAPAAEDPQRSQVDLFLAGAFAMTAAAIKREQQRLGAIVRRSGEQFERTPEVGLGMATTVRGPAKKTV
jgi:hypothetical protein